MKLRSTTTPASISKVAKYGLVLTLIIATLVGGYMYINRPASANYNARINQLQAERSRFQQEAMRLNNEATSLSNTLAQLTNEKNALQSQVDLTQARHDQLTAQITETEAEIEKNRKALGSTIVDLYAGDSVSPVEILASSQNFGDFLDKQEYRSSVKDSLNTTIKHVKDLRTQLQDQKKEVVAVLDEQKQARDSLAAKEAEQATILAKTQNEEAGFRELIKGREAEIENAKELQRALDNAYRNAILNQGGSAAGYGWNESNCPMLGMLSTGGANGRGGDGRGYGCRQCASYVAWKIWTETGNWYQWGDAKNFTANAKAEGYRDLGMNPEPGSIAVMNPAKAGQQYGHVAWVEGVSGNDVTISQYNYNWGAGYGLYSKMTMSKYAFDHYVKIK